MDIRTDYQKRQDKMHDKIVNLYKNLMEEAPELSLHRAATLVGQQIGWTAYGVKKVLAKKLETTTTK